MSDKEQPLCNQKQLLTGVLQINCSGKCGNVLGITKVGQFSFRRQSFCFFLQNCRPIHRHAVRPINYSTTGVLWRIFHSFSKVIFKKTSGRLIFMKKAFYRKSSDCSSHSAEMSFSPMPFEDAYYILQKQHLWQ